MKPIGEHRPRASFKGVTAGPASLTNNTGQPGDSTINAAGSTYNSVGENTSRADLAKKINEIIQAFRDAGILY